MKEVVKYASGLDLGDAQQHNNMAMFPLMDGSGSKLEYMVFDEAVNSGLNIRETGSVPTLHFRNSTGHEVLIMQGEYVKGGKQDRMVATNVYMEKGYDGDVPVNCVQQGRWAGGATAAFASACRSATPRVRGAVSRGQGEVWEQVRTLGRRVRVESSTQNIREMYEQKEKDIGDYLSNFSYVRSAVGIVVAVQQGQTTFYGADIFDQPAAMEKNFRKLLESYAMEALAESGKADVSKKDAARFLNHLEDCAFEERKPVSLGRDFVVSGKKEEGSALVYEGIPIYVNLGTKQDGRKETPGHTLPGHIRTSIFRQRGHTRIR